MNIAKRVISILSLSLIFSFNSFVLAQNTQNNFEQALAKEGVTSQEFERITSHYYEDPQPEKIIPIVRAALTQQKFILDNFRFIPFAHFIAAIAHNNQDVLKELKNLQSSDLDDIQKKRVEYIIEETKYIPILPDGQTPEELNSFLWADVYAPARIDCTWAEFFATGDEKAIEKIITILVYPATEDNDFRKATRSAAEKALAADAQQHKKVYEIIEKRLSSATGESKEKLEKILKKAQEAN